MWNDLSISITHVIKDVFSLSTLLTMANGFKLWITRIYGPSRYREHPNFGKSYLIYPSYTLEVGYWKGISTSPAGPTKNQMEKLPKV